jgi:hypothetical protein
MTRVPQSDVYEGVAHCPEGGQVSLPLCLPTQGLVDLRSRDFLRFLIQCQGFLVAMG